MIFSWWILKINFKCDGSYTDSPDWIKNKTIDLIKKRNKCFQYAVTTALNYKGIKKYPQGTTNIIPFIDKNNWEWIDYP